jgi:hypothetical protein
MYGLIDHINDNSSSGSCQTSPATHAERSGSDLKRDKSIAKSKYVIENNKIIYEQYDRYGRLISRVPWAANQISAKA